MDSTTTAIIITQIPIAVAIFILAYEVHTAKRAFLRLLELIIKKVK
jgi:hypothetical protein